jgi:predicted DNA-binding protein (MmcQ/YjbR family)
MDATEVRRLCLGFAEAVEERPFGPQTTVFKVGGKIFAIVALEAEPPLRISLKCEPELVPALRAANPAINPGYHLNKRHWNTVTLDGSLPGSMVRDLVEDSYDLVVMGLPKAARERLRPQ